MSEIRVVVENEERVIQYEDVGVTFDSSSDEIIEAIAPGILEDTGVDINAEGLYTVKKTEDSQNVYVFPKSPAGL